MLLLSSLSFDYPGLFASLERHFPGAVTLALLAVQRSGFLLEMLVLEMFTSFGTALAAPLPAWRGRSCIGLWLVPRVWDPVRNFLKMQTPQSFVVWLSLGEEQETYYAEIVLDMQDRAEKHLFFWSKCDTCLHIYSESLGSNTCISWLYYLITSM